MSRQEDVARAIKIGKMEQEVSRLKRNLQKAFDEINREMPLPKADDYIKADEYDVDAVANEAWGNGYAAGLAKAIEILSKALETEEGHQ